MISLVSSYKKYLFNLYTITLIHSDPRDWKTLTSLIMNDGVAICVVLCSIPLYYFLFYVIHDASGIDSLYISKNMSLFYVLLLHRARIVNIFEVFDVRSQSPNL